MFFLCQVISYFPVFWAESLFRCFYSTSKSGDFTWKKKIKFGGFVNSTPGTLLVSFSSDIIVSNDFHLQYGVSPLQRGFSLFIAKITSFSTSFGIILYPSNLSLMALCLLFISFAFLPLTEDCTCQSIFLFTHPFWMTDLLWIPAAHHYHRSIVTMSAIPFPAYTCDAKQWFAQLDSYFVAMGVQSS